MKRFFLILFIFLLPAGLYSQSRFFTRSHDAYYVKDSMVVVGVKVIDGLRINGIQTCRVITSKDTLVFTPYDIDEYGNGQSEFISATIFFRGQEKRVFLKRLVKGDMSLYSYRLRGNNMYYLEKEKGVFIDLPRRWEHNRQITFKNILEDETSDCQYTSFNLMQTSYNSSSLSQFIHSYNHCSAMPSLPTRFGVLAGYSFLDLRPSSYGNYLYVQDFSFTKKPDVFFGVFWDQPLFFTFFSAHLGVNYYQMSESFYTFSGNNALDFLVKSSSLQIPFQLRYYYPLSNNIKPFINAGGIYSSDIRNESTIFRTTFFQEIISIEEPIDVSPAKGNSFGFVAGIGGEYRFGLRQAVLIELRYVQQNALNEKSPTSVLFDKRGMQLLIGISF